MRHGFSLVELSIVLVILGLLAGGVLTGQSLIRAAELRSVTTEFSKYQAAVNTFRDKYFQLPGDMNNAISFWGAAHATPATCLTTAGTGTQTCNGDGDGAVEAGAAASARSEMFMFWQHMAIAGLIEGSYGGMAGSGGLWDSTVGVNVPKAKMGNGGWSAVTVDYAADGSRYDVKEDNHFEFGGKRTAGTTDLQLLKPEEAWNIDTKIDDGKPAYGSLIAVYWNNACAAADDGTHANNDLAASYRLTDSSVQCALYFIKAF
jgi:prepilin-type N-terminal cleavage/methylation domain-containing protein